MPTYDYACRGCGNRFESRHGITAAAPRCPRCGGGVQRLFLSAPAVHGHMARGRELAMRTVEPQGGGVHGPGCPCCH